MRQTVDAYRAGDLEWLLQQTHPEAEIVQPPEIPGASTYRGREGMIDALLDWPREWEDFQVEPKRIFAVDDDQVVVVALHRGRSRRIEIEVEAEIAWLFTRRDGLTTRWDMFMSVEQALSAAEQAHLRSSGADNRS
jgi:ketosteroid isomerase-like protein